MNDSTSVSQNPSSAKKDLPMKPEQITKNYKTLTGDQLALALTTPELANHVLSVVAKLNDHQLQASVPVMTLDQIKLMIPKLQLQQSGVAVQAMSPEQIRTAIVSLTSDDRHLLMQNISLLTSSSNKDELQSFISFVDPLAMAIAVQLPELTTRIVEAAGVMTIEQIRVCIPLLNQEQIRDIIAVLEHENQVTVAISMIDKRDELIKLLKLDFTKLVKRKEEIIPRLTRVKEQFPDLAKSIGALPQSIAKDSEYEVIVRTVKNLKTEIESLQQTIRELQASYKLPQLLLSSKEVEELRVQYDSLAKETKSLGKECSEQFHTLSGNDGLTNELNKVWEKLKSAAASLKQEETPTMSPPGSPLVGCTDLTASVDSIFVEEDRATLLYEAIKNIGNPEAVGSHYSMTWNDIIHAGFRESRDFQEKGIASLEQLQQYIDARKK